MQTCCLQWQLEFASFLALRCCALVAFPLHRPWICAWVALPSSPVLWTAGCTVAQSCSAKLALVGLPPRVGACYCSLPCFSTSLAEEVTWLMARSSTAQPGIKGQGWQSISREMEWNGGDAGDEKSSWTGRIPRSWAAEEAVLHGLASVSW